MALLSSKMQCLAGVVLVFLFIQNSLGEVQVDPACGDGALSTYMRRFNNEQNEQERAEELEAAKQPEQSEGPEIGETPSEPEALVDAADPETLDDATNSEAPAAAEDPEDPEARMRLFRMKSHHVSFFPAERRHEINIIPGGTWYYPPTHTTQMFSFEFDISSNTKIYTLFHTLQYKVNVSMKSLIYRLSQLYIRWPEVKRTLQMRHSVSFRDVFRAAFNVMYPEWGQMKLNMIFGGITDEAVLKELFIAMFPNWPSHEIADIFSPTNTIPLILRKLLIYLIPDMSQSEINYIFSDMSSVLPILQKIHATLFPWYSPSELAYAFSIHNSVLNIFDKLIHELPKPTPPPEPFNWNILYSLWFPGLPYGKAEPDLYFLLQQFKITHTMDPVKREVMLLLILREWLKKNPNIEYILPAVGMDDFEHFKNTLFLNVPSYISISWDENMLRELFEIWKRIILGHWPHSKQFSINDVLNYILKYLREKPVPTPGSTTRPTLPTTTTPAPTLPPTPPIIDEIPSKITIIFIQNLNVLPKDMKLRLIELFNLRDKTKSANQILAILSDWQKHNLKRRVPLSKLMEILLRILAPKWSDTDVSRVVGWNLNLEQILINLFKVMFLEWPGVSVNPDVSNLNSPKFILEMFLKKALPHIAKEDLEVLFNDTDDMEVIVRRILKLMFPQWPRYNFFVKHFDPLVLEKVLSEIINWPNTKSAIIKKRMISIPLLIESFMYSLYPSWPQYMVSMITVGRTPIPLVTQKLLQLLTTDQHDKNILLQYGDKSVKIIVSEELFRIIFPQWPNISVPLSIESKKERQSLVYDILRLLKGRLSAILKTLACLRDGEYNWIAQLLTGMMNFLIKGTSDALPIALFQ